MLEQYQQALNHLQNQQYKQAALILYAIYRTPAWQPEFIQNQDFFWELMRSIRKGIKQDELAGENDTQWQETFENRPYQIAHEIGIQARTEFPTNARIKNEYYWNVFYSGWRIPWELNEILQQLSPHEMHSPFDEFIINFCETQLAFSINQPNGRGGWLPISYQLFKERLNNRLGDDLQTELDVHYIISLMEKIDLNVEKREYIIKRYAALLPRLYYAVDSMAECLNVLLKFREHLMLQDKTVLVELLLIQHDWSFTGLLAYLKAQLNVIDANSLKRYILFYTGIVEDAGTGLFLDDVVSLMVGHYNWAEIADRVRDNNPLLVHDNYNGTNDWSVSEDIGRILSKHNTSDKIAILGNCLLLLQSQIIFYRNPIFREIQPEWTAVTEISQYKFCRISYAIIKTYKVSSNEFQELGIQMAETSRINQLRDAYSHRPYFYERRPRWYNINCSEELFFQFLNDIRNSTELYAGHGANNGTYFTNNEEQIRGEPDFVYCKPDGTKFIIEEKYTSARTQIIKPYDSHKLQLLAYLYAFTDLQAAYGYLVYWEIMRHDNGLKRVSIFKFEKNEENHQYYLDNLQSFKNFKAIKIEKITSMINLNKCIKCSVNMYCKHKFGEISTVALPYTA